eukprot:485723-Pelagomonas_calceolata.AAC.2
MLDGILTASKGTPFLCFGMCKMVKDKPDKWHDALEPSAQALLPIWVRRVLGREDHIGWKQGSAL